MDLFSEGNLVPLYSIYNQLMIVGMRVYLPLKGKVLLLHQVKNEEIAIHLLAEFKPESEGHRMYLRHEVGNFLL